MYIFLYKFIYNKISTSTSPFLLSAHVFLLYHALSTGCSLKIVFFHNSLQPLPHLHRSRDLQSSQRIVSVQSLGTPIGKFLYNQYQPSAGEGEVANLREFLEKHNI